MSKGLSQFRPRGQIEASPRMFGVEEYTEASGDVDDRGTPWELFLALHEEFGFTIDVASSDANAKLIRHWTQDDDGLEKSWGGGSACGATRPTRTFAGGQRRPGTSRARHS